MAHTLNSDTGETKRVITRVWDMVNKHFGSLLLTADRSATKNKAEMNVQAQVKELRELMNSCDHRLKAVQDYVSELQKVEKKGSEGSVEEQVYSQFIGEWHFLYTNDNRVFGYMKMVPGTVSILDNDNGSGAQGRRAEFTLPKCVLQEADLCSDDYNRDTGFESVSCSHCNLTFEPSRYWKHALYEIAERGNTVLARESVNRGRASLWIVESCTSWTESIYRPRKLQRTCEIGQCLRDIQLTHLLREQDFSGVLDNALSLLSTQLRV